MPALAQEDPSLVPDPVGEIYKVVKANTFQSDFGRACLSQQNVYGLQRRTA
jgi:hypothetical protein